MSLSSNHHYVQQQVVSLYLSLKHSAIQLMGNQHDAEDLLHATIVRILNASDRFKPETNFQAWAYTIMRNIFINEFRKKSRRRKILSYTIPRPLLNKEQSTASNLGESQLEQEELKGIIDGLSLDFRIPFVLAYQGYNYQEIAEELNLPLGTVKSRIFFARKKLQYAYAKSKAVLN